jgi:aspartate/methionine/tyrosine aminotransferase
MGERRPTHRPELVVNPEELAGVDGSLALMRPVPGSRMFEIKKALKIYLETCPGAPTFDASQGDGGASLPGVPTEILDEAHRLLRAKGTAYDQPYGTDDFRRAVVEDYWCLDEATGWGPANVLACQGGRDALLRSYEAALALGHGRRGDFVLASRVPWISYSWGPYGVGANVLLAPGRESDAWQLTPEGIAESVAAAEALGGRRIALVVLTSPDNPTGRTLTLERQLDLTRAALEAGIPFVLLDWIYHRVTDGAPHDLNAFLRALEPAERDRCIILDGITKSLGGSNIRNAHLVASQELVRFSASRASHGVIPSFHSQAVAIAAYRAGFDRVAAPIVGPTNASRAVLQEELERRGMRHIIGKGYYAFLDVGPWLDRAGLTDSAALGSMLAERFGVAVVPGVYFSPYGGRWLRFSYALQPATTAAAFSRMWEGLSSLG